MDAGDPDPEQLRFEDGDLVEPEGDGVRAAEPIEPGTETGFVLEVRDDALEVNDRLVRVVELHGRTLVFGSRSRAEAYADQLSADGGALRVQAAPENDSRDVDAYLLAAHEPAIAEPADVDDDDTWTFDVGANLYGALGEAIVRHAPKPYALEHFVRGDLDVDERELDHGLRIDVEDGYPVAVEHEDGAVRWIPDCVVVARDGWNGPVLEEYYCEIKAGNASFQRSQVAAMEALARSERVVKIRVLLDGLPEAYAVRIEDVGPDAE